MTREEAIEKGFKEFQGDCYTVMAHPKSCFFCEKCLGILYDFTHGPYGFICEKEKDIDKGLEGKCESFI